MIIFTKVGDGKPERITTVIGVSISLPARLFIDFHRQADICSNHFKKGDRQR